MRTSELWKGIMALYLQIRNLKLKEFKWIAQHHRSSSSSVASRHCCGVSNNLVTIERKKWKIMFFLPEGSPPKSMEF